MIAKRRTNLASSKTLACHGGSDVTMNASLNKGVETKKPTAQAM